MAGRFVLRRSHVAREQVPGRVSADVEQVATLVALLTTLADRMDALASTGLEGDRDRRARVQLIRRTVEAGRRRIEAPRRQQHQA